MYLDVSIITLTYRSQCASFFGIFELSFQEYTPHIIPMSYNQK